MLLHAGLQQLRREHGPLADGIQVLLGALPGVKAEMPGHAVLSADWYWPTGHSATGGAAIPDPEAAARHHRLIEGRQTAEADCLAALSARHALLREFTELVQVTRHYTVIREEQARSITLGWPLLRDCALRLGHGLAGAGSLDTGASLLSDPR